jgi:hypothetical protein
MISVSGDLDFTFWPANVPPLDSRFQIPDSGFQIPDSRFRIPDSRFQIPDSGFRIPDLLANPFSSALNPD